MTVESVRNCYRCGRAFEHMEEAQIIRIGKVSLAGPTGAIFFEMRKAVCLEPCE